MIKYINEIESANWQISTQGLGHVVEGAQDVSQSIALVILTEKMSDPFRPTFGSDLFDYIDQPIQIAGPGMRRAIIDAVTLWEKRVKLLKVSYVYQNQEGGEDGVLCGLKFGIQWGSPNSQIQGELELLVSQPSTEGPGSPTILILATESGAPILTLNQYIKI